jgi:hypothetical protein
MISDEGVGETRRAGAARARLGGRPTAIFGLITRYRELVFVVAVTGVALFLRTYELLDYPPGFHGDEGLLGMDAQRVLREGWIGPYLGSGGGYAAGPVYWTALIFRIGGSSDFNVRLSTALLGTVAVPIAYYAFRIMFGFRVAVLASIFFAFSAFDIHYSRVGYMPVAQPIIEVATMLPLFLAVRTRRWYYFLIAGTMAGFGAFSYSPYPVFVAGLALFLLWFAVRGYWWRHLHTFVRDMALFWGAFYFAALSMIQYARNEPGFLNHARAESIRSTREWKNAHGLLAHLQIVWFHAKDWFYTVTSRPKFDGVDATGIGHMFDRLSLYLIAAGVVIVILNWRRLPYAFTLIMFAVLPFGAILTIGAGFRRTIGLLPMLFVLMALPLERVWRWADAAPAAKRTLGYGLVGAAVAFVCIYNVRYYFGTLASSEQARWTYVEELADASRYIEKQHPDYVYFYSARWGYGYPTRSYLAPDVPGEDRSKEFSKLNGSIDVNTSRDAMFLFIGGYMDLLPEVQQKYPGGIAHIGTAGDGRKLFATYRLPSHAKATVLP